MSFFFPFLFLTPSRLLLSFSKQKTKKRTIPCSRHASSERGEVSSTGPARAGSVEEFVSEIFLWLLLLKIERQREAAAVRERRAALFLFLFRLLSFSIFHYLLAIRAVFYVVDRDLGLVGRGAAARLLGDCFFLSFFPGGERVRVRGQEEKRRRRRRERANINKKTPLRSRGASCEATCPRR